MTNADKIRLYGEEKYVLHARQNKLNRFSIRVGDIVRDLKLTGRAPAVLQRPGRPMSSWKRMT